MNLKPIVRTALQVAEPFNDAAQRELDSILRIARREFDGKRRMSSLFFN